MSSTFAIETKNLTRQFGNVLAVNNVSLAVPKESVFAFLGPNGAGKTTTIRMLLGLMRADSGQVFLNGSNILKDRKHALARVGSIVETPTLYPNLTGREILRISAQLLNAPKADISRVLSWVDLEKSADRKVGQYSLGMRQRLALARALLGEPKLLILDEPTNGLDPSGIVEMRHIIKSLPERINATVLLSSHMLAEIDKLADHCALIDHGTIKFQGQMSKLREQAVTSLRIGASNKIALKQYLERQGYAARTDEEYIYIDTPFDKDKAYLILKGILEKGIDVYHFESQPPELERIFLAITRSNEGVVS